MIDYDQGIRDIYFTPHYRRRGDNHYLLDICGNFLREVEEKCPDIYRNTTFHLAHELVYHEELLGRLKDGNAFPLDETGHILIEFDPFLGYDTMYRQLRELLNGGYIPVIAHMERYQALRDPEHVAEVKRAGCLLQVNYQSITGDGMTGREAPFGGIFSKEIKRVRGLITEGMIDWYGTDTHRRDYRPPEIKKALEWLKKND